MILASKFLLHQPLNRQSAAYAREGVEIEVSTLADWVGASVATLDPIVQLSRAHVFGAGRIHADDTIVKVLAKLKTITGRIWIYVRDDRPFATVVRITFDDNDLSTVKSRLLSSRSPRVSSALSRC